MNDRFKFRVFYEPHKKIYNVICLNCDKQKEIIIEYKGSSSIVEWKNCKILQCTGLKDKNGKLIFEADIVKDDHGAWHYVKWVYDSWQLFPCTQNNYTIGIVDDEIEVIGNIYQDSHLLEN